MILLLLNSRGVFAQELKAAEGQFEVTTDFIFIEKGNLFQDILIDAIEKVQISISLNCYRYASTSDSMLVYRFSSRDQKLKGGLNRLKFSFQGGGDYFVLPSFSKVFKGTELVPPGNYRIFTEISQGEVLFQSDFIREIDSSLVLTGKLGRGLLKVLQPLTNRTSFRGDRKGVVKKDYSADRILGSSRSRIERYFRKKSIVSHQYQLDGKEIIDAYYENWFVGRFEMTSNALVDAELKKVTDALEQNLGSLTTNTLANYRSLQAQFKELNKQSREHKELSGELALSGNWANGQEPLSGMDNNYYEVRGSLEFPVLDIPISLSGYYTTQDRQREAKASFIHFRYDAEKAKEQLMKLIGSYNKRYEQTMAQKGGLETLYNQYIQQMQAEKGKIITELKQQAGLSELDASSMDVEMLKIKAGKELEAEKSKINDSLLNLVNDSEEGTKAKALIDSIEKRKQQAVELYQKGLQQYERIMELERKIKKYEKLLNQYKSTAFYDSILAYDKMKDIKDLESMSYKDMAKRASGLLPESKTKSFITGITNFDAGMFPKYISSYTMSGQMLKGADLGYDIGIADIGFTYGKTEYIDRSGRLENYNSYSSRVMFKPIREQQFGLVYYGYSPGVNLLQDKNFLSTELPTLPSFRNPVHILSGTYSGTISKHIDATGEFAASNRQGQSAEAKAQVSILEQSAYNFNIVGNIPSSSVMLTAAYERAGKAFENNTLPMIMSGTEKIALRGKGDFYKGFLTVGMEYNYLIQSSLISKGKNSRWGFDIATHSRRYPSIMIAYKPFSTFRSFNDTLNIEQKPILGEVWTGKLNYQIKRLDKAIRFTILYNKNSSIMDTITYGSSLMQFNSILTVQKSMLSFTVGATNINPGNMETAVPVFNNNQFIALSGSTVFQSIMLNGGIDVAKSSIGISRYGFFVAPVYTFKRTPISIRTNFRYSNYRLDEVVAWKQLYSGGLELVWRFKTKLFE